MPKIKIKKTVAGPAAVSRVHVRAEGKYLKHITTDLYLHQVSVSTDRPLKHRKIPAHRAATVIFPLEDEDYEHL